MKSWIAALSVVVAVAGCATRTHIPAADLASSIGVSPVSPPQADPPFRYEAEPIEPDTEVIGRNRRYEVRRLRFPSIGDNGQPDTLVTVDFHRSLKPGAHPAVVVLPIWGRHVYPSNAITRTLRKRSHGSIHVLNVLGEGFLIDWPGLEEATDEDEFVEIWRQGAEREITTVIDLRRLLDWAEAQPEIDGDRFGLIGFSHGAILAPVLAAREPRISALVLVMGGADPHDVIKYKCQVLVFVNVKV